MLNRLWRWLKTSEWGFPAVLLAFFLVLTALRISGSSTGMYHVDLYGAGAKDTNLIYGQPRAIRSDEWLVATQMIVGQSKIGFPRVNSHMGAGQDLTLQAEVPTKDWSAFFKPQNWSFFVLPLEFAFAFKWWLLMYALIVSCYFFVRRVLPQDKLFAVIFSLAIGLSPFELWWYQTSAFLSVAYGFMMAILVMRLIDAERVKWIKNHRTGRWLQAGALAFVMTSFELILYPPFQIPIAVVLLFFGVGLIFQRRFADKVKWSTLFGRVVPIVAATVLAGALGGLFILTHRVPIDALNNSIYPGHRVVESGDMQLLNVFDAFVMPVEQSNFRGGHFITNQSEASNFILLLPFLLLPGLYLQVREWVKHRRIDWLFLALQGGALLLFIRVFTPLGGSAFKLLLLHKVPNKRLLIGIGFLGVLQLVYLLKKIAQEKFKQISLDAWGLLYGFACFLVVGATGIYITHHYPQFLASKVVALGLAAWFSAIIAAFVANRKLLAASLMLAFTLASTFRVIPLMRGLGELTHSQVIGRMEAISKPSDSWVTVGDDAGIYENFGLLAGRRSISGTQVYPNLALWSQLGPQYEYIYNREGHAFFTDSPKVTDPIISGTTDTFRVKFQCSKFIETNAQYALSVHPLSDPCVKLVETVRYPAVTFYLSKVMAP